MQTTVTMPKWGMTMDEGTITEWRKGEGDTVSTGEVLAMVETEKVEAELEAPVSGTLVKILVREGETAPVGTPIGIIEGISVSRSLDLRSDVVAQGNLWALHGQAICAAARRGAVVG